jgi:hypothetical protein
MFDESDFRFIINKYKDKFDNSQEVKNACEIIPREMKENGYIIDEFKSLETKGKIVNNCDILKSYIDCYNFEHNDKYLYYHENYIGDYNKKICAIIDIREKNIKKNKTDPPLSIISHLYLYILRSVS